MKLSFVQAFSSYGFQACWTRAPQNCYVPEWHVSTWVLRRYSPVLNTALRTIIRTIRVEIRVWLENKALNDYEIMSKIWTFVIQISMFK